MFSHPKGIGEQINNIKKPSSLIYFSILLELLLVLFFLHFLRTLHLKIFYYLTINDCVLLLHLSILFFRGLMSDLENGRVKKAVIMKDWLIDIWILLIIWVLGGLSSEMTIRNKSRKVSLKEALYELKRASQNHIFGSIQYLIFSAKRPIMAYIVGNFLAIYNFLNLQNLIEKNLSFRDSYSIQMNQSSSLKSILTEDMLIYNFNKWKHKYLILF